MATQPLISVIVPIYNAEGYLERCMKSLLSQTLSDIEIILVDDGSTDNSGVMCERYAQQDDRISVFHQPNSGVAATRQRGVDMAQGLYSIHVDPDDWVEPTMLEELYSKAMESDADMVICNFVAVYPKKNKLSIQKIGDDLSPKACLNKLLQNKIHGSLCTKLIRTALYRKFDIRFIAGLNYCEDYIVCAKMFMQDIKIAYHDKALYYYDQIVNNHSITRKYTLDTLRQRMRFVKELQKVLEGVECVGISDTITNVALECYKHRILSSVEFADTFEAYRDDFMRSNYKYKYRIVLRMAASGYQAIARMIS
ncbi:MAG: glycosyltransferase [Alistipes sp.]|nr:glycosyltransferase [Alistipes sp.]